MTKALIAITAALAWKKNDNVNICQVGSRPPDTGMGIPFIRSGEWTHSLLSIGAEVELAPGSIHDVEDSESGSNIRQHAEPLVDFAAPAIARRQSHKLAAWHFRTEALVGGERETGRGEGVEGHLPEEVESVLAGEVGVVRGDEARGQQEDGAERPELPVGANEVLGDLAGAPRRSKSG